MIEFIEALLTIFGRLSVISSMSFANASAAILTTLKSFSETEISAVLDLETIEKFWAKIGVMQEENNDKDCGNSYIDGFGGINSDGLADRFCFLKCGEFGSMNCRSFNSWNRT